MRVISEVPGKCILFGEHAVVYGFPAIALAIPMKSKCIIEEREDELIYFKLKTFNKEYRGRNLDDILSRLPHNYHHFISGLNLISNRYDLKLNSLDIEIDSDITSNAGLGSSASTSTALLTAINNFYDLDLKKAEIAQYIFEMEKITHGNPSGIDHTTCLFGNIIFFQKGKFHLVYPPDDFQILITYSNQVHNTKQVVSNVRKLKEEKSYLFESIVDKIGFYTEIAELELTSGNYEEVGKLMNFNQDLLSQLNVSNDEIDKINKIALKNGAYGSKLTGAGLGGCVVTVGREKSLKKLSKIFRSEGYWNILTSQDKLGAMSLKEP